MCFLFVALPDSLMFPTAAFSSAALLWINSYSVLSNGTKTGKSYKELSDGSVAGLVEILYHLKGNINQLPELINIWRRIRLVRAKNVDVFFLSYKQFLKLTFNHINNI